MRLVFLICCCPAVFAADAACPWMNDASASGYLETAVHLAVVNQGDGGTCAFSGKRGAASLDLKIEVTALAEAKTPECGPDSTPLRGIGNEAAACGYDVKSGKVSEQVVGRVRKQAFLVRLTSSDGSARRAELRETVRKAAEQVAGNLF